MNAPSIVSALILSLSLGSLASCKQGEGDYCQVNSDCDDGLLCIPGIDQCQKPGSSQTPDASTPTIDAAVVDAATTDADIDADTTDADIDADL